MDILTVSLATAVKSARLALPAVLQESANVWEVMREEHAISVVLGFTVTLNANVCNVPLLAVFQ